MHSPLHSTALTSQLLTSPFIVASPSPSPTNAAAAAAAAAATTTTIHMDSTDGSESFTESTFSQSGSDAAHHHQQQQQREEGNSLSTYQLASAALRRLPARPAPPPSSIQQQRQGVRLEDSAAHRENMQKPSRGVGGAASSAAPSPSRFRIPPSLSSTSAASSPAAVRHRSPAHLSASPSHSHVRAVSGATHSESRTNDDDDDEDEEAEEDVAARVLLSLRHKDDVIGQLTDAVAALREENAALRRRASTTAAVGSQDAPSGAEAHTTSSRSPPSSPRERAALPSQDTTPEMQRVHAPAAVASPSLPPTPVRWWKRPKGSPTHHTTAAPTTTRTTVREEREHEEVEVGESQNTHQDRLDVSHASSPSTSFAAAHAAVSTVAALHAALAARDAELASVTAQLAEAQRGKTEQLSGGSGDNAVVLSDSVQHDDRGIAADSVAGAVMQAALESAEAHAARLAYQLDSLQEERREDTRTLRAHIDHLTREGKAKDKELRRQDRQHKSEMALLEREVSALADQLETQLRAATAVGATSVSQQDLLQHQLADANLREEKLRREHAAQQQQWRTAMAEQCSIAEAASRAAEQSEQQARTRNARAATVAQQLTAQQQQVEAELQEWKARATYTQRELSELRSVHQRTEEVVAVQRTEAREVAESLAAATVQQTQAEQYAARLEGQVALLQRQVQHLSATAAAREEEVAELRRAKDVEARDMLAQHDAEHDTLLRQVEGCVRGSEAVESALLTAEARRREVAAQLAQALEERDDVHRKVRDMSVQTQAQLLEQQELFQEVQASLQQRWETSQQQLADCQSELEARTHQLTDTQAAVAAAEAAHTAVAEEKRALLSQLHAAQESNAQLTQHLVQRTEALRDALRTHLASAKKLHLVEQRRRRLQEAAERSATRQAREKSALRGLVALLHAQPLLHASTCADQGRRQGALNAVAATTTTTAAATATAASATHARSAQTKWKRGGDGAVRRVRRSATNDVDGTPNPGRHITHAATPHRERNVRSDEDEDCSSRSFSSTEESTASLPHSTTTTNSTTAESVAMSAVHTDGTAATPLSASMGADTTDVEGHVYMHPKGETEKEEEDVRSCGARAKPLHADDANGLSHALVHEGEEGGEVSVLRTLFALHHDVQRLLDTHRALAEELGTKRTAVRTLMQARKAQQTALEKAQATLVEHKKEAEKRRQELVKALRVEAQMALDTRTTELEKQHTADAIRQLQEAERQHTQQQHRLLKRSVTHVRTQLIRFLAGLPQTLSDVVAAVTVPAAVAPSAADVAAAEAQRVWAAQACAAGGDAPYSPAAAAAHLSAYRTQQQEQQEGHMYTHFQPTCAAAREEEARAVEAECDAIARDVLGLAGGWSDLAAAIHAADNGAAGAESAARLPLPPAHPAEEVWRSAAVEVCTPVAWPTHELQELQTVLDSYLVQVFTRFATETATVVPPHTNSSSSGNNNNNNGRRVAEDSVEMAEEADADERKEEPAVAMGLERWTRSLRQPDATEASRRGVGGGVPVAAAAAAAASGGDGARGTTNVLAAWMSACVAHVAEETLRSGVVHVFD